VNDNEHRDPGNEDAGPAIGHLHQLRTFNDDQVAFLQMLTAQAEAGELAGFVVSFVYNDGRAGSMAKYHSGPPIELLLGVATKAQHSLLVQLTESERRMAVANMDRPN
jgi:hypothetical protein